jgi:uncharacterized protein (UPF0548 family)
VKVLRRGDTDGLARALAATTTQQPTWHGDPDAAVPAGFHLSERRRLIGSGEQAFRSAVETVMTWGVQRGSGLVVHAEDDRVRLGGNVIVGLPLGPALILAPCRVCDVWDAADRCGFRYVTLPGHPETGFEDFVVERTEAGEVWFAVRPVSRPGSVLTRLAGPLATILQRRAATRYLDAVVAG